MWPAQGNTASQDMGTTPAWDFWLQTIAVQRFQRQMGQIKTKSQVKSSEAIRKGY
jgi:hypothetical protein